MPNTNGDDEEQQGLLHFADCRCEQCLADVAAYDAKLKRRRQRAQLVREKDVDQYLVKRVHELGGLCSKWEGVLGAPDRIVMLPGHDVVFVEVKSATGKVRASQLAFHEKMRKAGGKVYVLRSKEDVDSWLHDHMLSAHDA